MPVTITGNTFDATCAGCCETGTGTGTGSVLTDCCSNTIPETLYLTITGCNAPDLADMDGTYPITYKPAGVSGDCIGGWYTDGTLGAPTPCFGTFCLICVAGVWDIIFLDGTPLGIGGGLVVGPTLVSCDPLIITYSIQNTAKPAGTTCCSGDTILFTITE